MSVCRRIATRRQDILYFLEGNNKREAGRREKNKAIEIEFRRKARRGRRSFTQVIGRRTGDPDRREP